MGTEAGWFRGPGDGGGGQARSRRGSSMGRARYGRRGEEKKAAAADALEFRQTLRWGGGGEDKEGGRVEGRG